MCNTSKNAAFSLQIVEKPLSLRPILNQPINYTRNQSINYTCNQPINYTRNQPISL